MFRNTRHAVQKSKPPVGDLTFPDPKAGHAKTHKGRLTKLVDTTNVSNPKIDFVFTIRIFQNF